MIDSKDTSVLKDAATGIFDWEEISKRSLGPYWKKRTDEEKKEFSDLMKDYLANIYIKRIDASYSGKEKFYYDAAIVKGGRAFVVTRILNKNGAKIKIEYRLKNKVAGLLIYDVLIEGVSLIKNYSVQFCEIIKKEGYNELKSRLQDKTKS